MRKRSSFRAPFVATLGALFALPGCGGQTSADGGAGSGANGGAGGKPPTAGACPTKMPGAGTACAGAPTCTYDECATTGQSRIVSCKDGSWTFVGMGSCGNPPPPMCPATLPANGDACSANGMQCSYGSACCPDETATCDGGAWVVMAIDCNPPPPPPCPAAPPSAGTPCASADPCARSIQTCSYATCNDPSLGPNLEAHCDGSVWSISQTDQCAPVAPCEKLSACECFDRSDCKAVSDGCLCSCDYDCPGDPPCDCACGGGTYLGCTPI